jgi:hypothetical protein
MNFTLQTTVKAVEPKVNPAGVAISRELPGLLKIRPLTELSNQGW